MLSGGRDPTYYSTVPVRIPKYNGPHSDFQWEVVLTQMLSGGNVPPTNQLPNDGKKRTAVFDTASPLITLTNADATPILEPLGVIPIYHRSQLLPPAGTRTTRAGLKVIEGATQAYAYPCKQPLQISVAFGAPYPHLFAIDPMDLNLGRLRFDGDGFQDVPGSTKLHDALNGPEPICLAAIVSVEHDKWGEYKGSPRHIFLGVPFLQSWYATFGSDPVDLTRGDYVDLALAGAGGKSSQPPDTFPFVGGDVSPAVPFVSPDAPGPSGYESGGSNDGPDPAPPQAPGPDEAGPSNWQQLTQPQPCDPSAPCPIAPQQAQPHQDQAGPSAANADEGTVGQGP